MPRFVKQIQVESCLPLARPVESLVEMEASVRASQARGKVLRTKRREKEMILYEDYDFRAK